MSGAIAPVAQPSSEPSNTPFNNLAADDPDLVLLRQAEAELRGDTAAPVSQPEPEQQQPQAPAPQDTPAAAPPQGAIPLPRFQQVARERQAAIEEASYWRGVAEAARAGQGQPQQQQAPAQPAPQQYDPMALIRAAETDLLAAADKWEGGGEMTAAEWEKARMGALARIMDARDSIFASRIMAVVQDLVAQQGNRLGLVDAQTLEAQVQTLEARHTWLQVMSDEDIKALERIALTEAEARGKPFGNGPQGVYRLRQRIAEMSDVYGPQWYPGTTPPAASAAPAAPQQAAPTLTPPPPTGQIGTRPSVEDVRANLDRQAAHPPMDPTGRTSADATLTLERVDTMNDEQVETGVSVDRLRALVGLPPRR